MQHTKNNSLHYTAIFIILIIGAIFRFNNLGAESIWIDEGYSIAFSKLNFVEVLTVEDDFPPLYYIILHFWIKLFGTSEVSVRFPSLIFGIFSIWTIYHVGRVIYNRQKGLIAALLLSISSFHIHYSQEARPYSLTVFLALLSMYYLVKCNQDGKIAASIGYVITTTLLVYSHVIGLYLVAAQNLYIVTLYLFYRKALKISLKNWILMQGVIGLFFLIWLPTFVVRIFDDARGTWLDVPTLHDIRLTLRKYAGSYLLKISLLLILASMLSFKAISFSQVRKKFVRSLQFLKPQIIEKDAVHNWMLLLFTLVPILLPFFLSQIFTPLYHHRYTIIASLSFYVLLASGIINLKSTNIRYGVIVIIFGISVFNTMNYYHSVTREPWREVAKFLTENSHSSDMLIFNSGDHRTYAFNYYFDPKRIHYIDSPSGLDLVSSEKLEKWTAEATNHQRVWVVLTYNLGKSNLIYKALVNTHRPIKTAQFMGIQLHLFQNRNTVHPILNAGKLNSSFEKKYVINVY